MICANIRSGFLTCSPFLSDSNEIVYINDETLLIKSFDTKRIQSWNDFEYILSVIIENRILKVYVGHLVEQNSKKMISIEDKVKKPKKKKPKRQHPQKKKSIVEENGKSLSQDDG